MVSVIPVSTLCYRGTQVTDVDCHEQHRRATCPRTRMITMVHMRAGITSIFPSHRNFLVRRMVLLWRGLPANRSRINETCRSCLGIQRLGLRWRRRWVHRMLRLPHRPISHMLAGKAQQVGLMDQRGRHSRIGKRRQVRAMFMDRHKAVG